MRRNLKVLILLPLAVIAALPATSVAHATPAVARASITNALRGAIGMAIGYGSDDAYQSLACKGNPPDATGQCDGPPQKGIVGAMADVINQLPTVNASAGISDCLAVPSSGSAMGTDAVGNDWPLQFQVPTHAIPAPWAAGGSKFQKRVAFSAPFMGESIKVAYEFNCGDSAAAYVAVNMPVGDNAPGYTRLITFYTGKISGSKNGVEVYLSEYNATSHFSRATDAIRIEYDQASHAFNLWGIMSHGIQKQTMNGWQSIDVMGRSIVSGDYVTGKASVLYSGVLGTSVDGNNGAINAADILATHHSMAASADLTDGTETPPYSYDLAGVIGADTSNLSSLDGTEVLDRGCVDFSSPDLDPADDSLCPDTVLAAPSSAPYLDATGSFTIAWALESMPAAMEVLP